MGIWINFFTAVVLRYWNKLSREVVGSASLGAFKGQVDVLLGEVELAALGEGLESMIFELCPKRK